MILAKELSWTNIISIDDLETIQMNSFRQPCLIYKHSSRCSISDIAFRRLQVYPESHSLNLALYFLDIIRFRSLSEAISTNYHVYHESPQVLVIFKGECIYDSSHLDIQWNDILGQVDLLEVV
jgi:bacillithiol system protein YtxJ